MELILKLISKNGLAIDKMNKTHLNIAFTLYGVNTLFFFYLIKNIMETSLLALGLIGME